MIKTAVIAWMVFLSGVGCEERPKSVLLIGDSIMENVKLDVSQHKVRHLTQSGADIEQILVNVIESESATYDDIFIMAGTNSLGNSDVWENFENVMQIAWLAKARFEGTVHVMTIPPNRNKDRAVWSAIFNQILRLVDTIKIIDVEREFLSRCEMFATCYDDKVHPNEYGNQLIRDMIVRAL